MGLIVNLVARTPLLFLTWLVACSAETSETACDLMAPADACHALDPARGGPFAVGVTTFALEDATRSGETGSRALKVEVWYPAVDSSRSAPRDAYDLAAEMPEDLRELLAGRSLPVVDQDAARDAEPMRSFEPYPILVFSHGNGGVRFQTFDLMTHLASHGYVVAAPDHTDDTLWDLMRDGFGVGTILKSLIDRPLDLAFVAETLAAIEGPLAGLVDLEHWGVFGHSFGGTTSIVTAAQGSASFDRRVKAVAPMAPLVHIVQVIGAGPDRGTVPLMMLAGVDDRTVDYENDPVYGYELAPAPKALVGIDQAGHFFFTVLCDFDLETIGELYDLDVSNVLDDGCGEGFIEPATMRAVLNWFVTAFFTTYLRDSPASAASLLPENVPADVAAVVELRTQGIQ